MNEETKPHNHTGNDCEYCGAIKVKIWKYITERLAEKEMMKKERIPDDEPTTSTEHKSKN